MKDRRLPALLLLALVACGNGAEEEREDLSGVGPHALTVRVVDSITGKPAEGVYAAVQTNKGEGKIKLKTDAEGFADFGLLPEGTYLVAAGRKVLGYAPDMQRIELTESTEVTLTLRAYEGLTVSVVVPPDRPRPDRVKIAYKREGRPIRVMTVVTLDEHGKGHTWAIFPGIYDMTFHTAGYPPIERRVEVTHEGDEPVVLELEAR